MISNPPPPPTTPRTSRLSQKEKSGGWFEQNLQRVKFCLSPRLNPRRVHASPPAAGLHGTCVCVCRRLRLLSGWWWCQGKGVGGCVEEGPHTHGCCRTPVTYLDWSILVVGVCHVEDGWTDPHPSPARVHDAPARQHPAPTKTREPVISRDCTTPRRVGGYRLRFRWTSNWGRKRNSPPPHQRLCGEGARSFGCEEVGHRVLGTDGEEAAAARTGGSGLCPSQCSGMVPCEASLGRPPRVLGGGWGRGTARCGRIYPAPGLGGTGRLEVQFPDGPWPVRVRIFSLSRGFDGLGLVVGIQAFGYFGILEGLLLAGEVWVLPSISAGSGSGEADRRRKVRQGHGRESRNLDPPCRLSPVMSRSSRSSVCLRLVQAGPSSVAEVNWVSYSVCLEPLPGPSSQSWLEAKQRLGGR